ncbi:MAG: hypothetical protein CL680_16640, partial [Blastomonas sp.]|nr:hypothetical protein [Blastomonas sp.]
MAFDPEAATRAYIDGLGAEALAKAAAYTASSEWMILGGLVVTLVVTLILVRLKLTDRIWARLERRGWALRTLLTVAGFSVASTVIALALAGAVLVGSSDGARASEGSDKPPGNKWSFAGPFGKFDRAALQRGLKVYKEVCSNC